MSWIDRSPAVVCMVACMGAAACGGGGSKGSPAAPSSPVATSITVTAPSEMLKLGRSETFTASATMSDGSARPVVGGVWGGDAPSVATVEASTGRVTGIGPGMVTVFVDYQGQRGTKLTRVVPDFHGWWSGSYFVEGCTATGAWADERTCDDVSAGEVLPADLVFWQDSDAIDGFLYLGSIEGNGRGTIEVAGGLVVTATAVLEEGVTVDSTWWLRSDQADRITGTLSWAIRVEGIPGDMRIDGRMRNMVRESAVIEAHRAPRTPGRAAFGRGGLPRVKDAITRRTLK